MCSAKYALALAKLETSENNLRDSFKLQHVSGFVHHLIKCCFNNEAHQDGGCTQPNNHSLWGSKDKDNSTDIKKIFNFTVLPS